MGKHFFYFQLNKDQWRRLIVSLILILTLGLFAGSRIYQPNELKILDIGQGDSLLIQTQDYKNILIDAGINGKVINELSRELFFFRPVIDLLIITHGDMDHYGGVFEVLEKYQVKAVLTSGVSTDGYLYRHLFDLMEEKNIPVFSAENHRDLQLSSNLYLDILYPIEGKSMMGQNIKNKNNASVSFRIMKRNTNGKIVPVATLTGDAEKEQELELLFSGQDLKAPHLKAGHHGSRTSTDIHFLQAVQPKKAYISAGEGNSFGHPHPETIDKFKDANVEVHSTIDEGVITINFNLPLLVGVMLKYWRFK